MMSDKTQTQKTPWHDTIVQELHDIRAQLVEKYHGDMSAYSQAATAHALALGFRIGLQDPDGPQADPAAFQAILAKAPHRTPLAGDE
jgi:hypothetical protein